MLEKQIQDANLRLLESKGLKSEMMYVWRENGQTKCSYKDPLCPQDERKEVDWTDVVAEMFGAPSPENPLLLQFSGLRLKRAEPINNRIVGEIRNGSLEFHIEDREGYLVELIESTMGSSSRDYPYDAQGYKKDGAPAFRRRYSLKGECEDGIPAHGLIAVYGPVESPDEED